jgi:hypothetical protein
MRRPSHLQDPDEIARQVATQVSRNQKDPVIYAIAQFMTPSITEKATGKVAVGETTDTERAKSDDFALSVAKSRNCGR